jgi:predicted exporter
LVARLTAARAGLPYRPTAFDAFRDNVAAERVMPPVTRAAITSRLIAARLDPLLFRRDGAWWGAIAPQGVTDAGAIRRAVAGVPGVVYLDMKAETDGIVAVVTTRAWRWVAVGAAAALVALGFGLRDVISVVRVVGAVAAAVLLTVALLTALGERLTLIHLVSLQLVAGVGLDYALFFARRQLDAEERARTLRTLVTCNAMTLLSFGLLALCRTPLLRDIGATVAIGALMAIACGFLFVGPRAAEPA